MTGQPTASGPHDTDPANPDRPNRHLPDRPRLAGVVGWPVSHSLSPLIHNHWFETNHVDGAYVRLPIQPTDLAKVFATLPLMGFDGVNVTIPHKENAFTLVDETDAAARRMKAVNTVLFMPDGRKIGRNTDGLGFSSAMFEAVRDFDPRKSLVVLLGTGGAARAIAATLIELGVAGLRLCNRTRARAEELASMLSQWSTIAIDVIDWEDRANALDGAGLLVNCTSLGMQGQNPLELDLSLLPVQSPVFDIVYNPLITPLLADARSRGHPIVDGLGMLLHQAVPGFEHWGRTTPIVDQALRDKVLRKLGGGT
jgi:shikimate dehydrogenase